MEVEIASARLPQELRVFVRPTRNGSESRGKLEEPKSRRVPESKSLDGSGWVRFSGPTYSFGGKNENKKKKKKKKN